MSLKLTFLEFFLLTDGDWFGLTLVGDDSEPILTFPVSFLILLLPVLLSGGAGKASGGLLPLLVNIGGPKGSTSTAGFLLEFIFKSTAFSPSFFLTRLQFAFISISLFI